MNHLPQAIAWPYARRKKIKPEKKRKSPKQWRGKVSYKCKLGHCCDCTKVDCPHECHSVYKLS